MPRGGKAAHVHADLGDDALGGAPVDAGDGAQPLELTPERGDHPVDLGAELGDRPVQEVDLGQDRAHQQGVVSAEATDEGLLQLGDLGAHPPAGELSEDRWIGDQRPWTPVIGAIWFDRVPRRGETRWLSPCSWISMG
jgi:hypothetical protein